MPDSISDDINTTGRVTVGSSVTGEIETAGDRDAYAVELEEGKTYQIDLEGTATGKGTLAIRSSAGCVTPLGAASTAPRITTAEKG